MKIVEAISDTNVGGAGVLLCTRLKHSDRQNFETTVILPRGSALKQRLERIGVAVLEIDGCRDRSFDRSAILEYQKILRQMRPDLVNCHGCLSCRIAARLCGIPIALYTRHCAYPLKAWQKTAAGKLFCGYGQQLLSDRMIAVAEAAKENLVDMGVKSERISVIINGVEGLLKTTETERSEIRRKLRIPIDSVVIGICARLEPCKGHEDFLKAAELLIRRSDQYRFLIVGGGSREQQLKRFCADRGLEPYVRFVGFAEDVAPYFNIVNINVNCSKGTETSSLALSEGMSLGIPAVVSDYGGNPYMVGFGENGLIYPVGRFDLLAKELERLANDPILYQKLSEKSYARFCNELNAVCMTAKTEALYSELYHSLKDRESSLRCRNKSKAKRHPRSS